MKHRPGQCDCVTARGRVVVAVLGILSGFVATTAAQACSRVYWNQFNSYKLVGRTMDLMGYDFPVLRKWAKGMARDGAIAGGAYTWTSKYGSAVISELGLETVVTDGMNTEGLAAHVLVLDGSVYEPRNENRPGCSTMMWVPLVLDNCATVNEALDLMNTVQIVPFGVGNLLKLHLAMEDASGDSAIVEFVDGQMTVHHGVDVRVMTNDPPYDLQMMNLLNYRPFGGGLALPGDSDPASRFVRLSAYLPTLPLPGSATQGVADMFNLLGTVTTPPGSKDYSEPQTEDAWPTYWMTVCDLRNRVIYFRDVSQGLNTVTVDLKSLNLDQEQPEQVLQLTSLELAADTPNPSFDNVPAGGAPGGASAGAGGAGAAGGGALMPCAPLPAAAVATVGGLTLALWHRRRRPRS